MRQSGKLARVALPGSRGFAHGVRDSEDKGQGGLLNQVMRG